MSSSWNGGVSGMICPTCTRAHFPYCGARDPPGHIGFAPHGHGLMPLAPLHNYQQPMTPNVGFNRPLSPLGPPHHGRHEGFFEQNHGPRPLHGGHSPNFNAMPRLGHPLPTPHDAHAVDRFGPVILGGVHNWAVEEDRERERRRQWEREKNWGVDQQRKDLVLPLDSIPSNFQRSNQQSGFYSGIREANELGMEGHARSDDYHNYKVRFEGFEPLQGGLRGSNVPFEHAGEMKLRRMNEALDFEHNVQQNNRDSGMGMEMCNEYRNFHSIQSEFAQGSCKRARMDGGDGRVFGSDMERIDNRFLGHQNSHHPGSSEYHNAMQSLNHISGDRVNTSERVQMEKDVSTSNKRKQLMSREEELLIEHGLLEDSPDRTDSGPYKSQSLLHDKAFSQESKQGFGFPLSNVGNSDHVRLPKSAHDVNAFSQKFHPTITEGTYHGNALDRGYSFNLSQDNLHSSAYMEARDQNRDAPSHLQGSQRDLSQRQSLESGRFWHDKHNDRNSVVDDKTRTPEIRSTFHATKDGFCMSTQESAGGPFIPGGGGVNQSDSNKGGFEEYRHSSGGNAIQNFSSRTQLTRERQQDESLKTIEELHMDFVQQQQQKICNQSHFQAARFQEESRRDEGRHVFLDTRQHHSQFVGRNQIEVLREESNQYGRDQTNYNQMQQLQTIHLGEPNSTQDQIEFKSRTGDLYGDRVHHSNIQAQNNWSQPLQCQNFQSDIGLMNSYPSAYAHNYEPSQHPPHHMVQEHNLQIHEQQQRLHQPEHQKTNLHENQHQELQLMPNQVPQNVQPSHQNQLKLQQNDSSQVPQQQFQQNFKLQEQQSLPSHQLMFEKQHTSERYQLQQGGNQETGKQYQHNQQMPQFSQQPEQYRHLNGHQKIPQFEQAEHKSQHIFTGGGPVSQVSMYGGHELKSDGCGLPHAMPISASIPKGQSLIQIPQVSTVVPPAPPLPPPPLPPSPPSSPAHSPPPPPPSHSASPPKSSASASYSSAVSGTHPLPTSMRSFPDIIKPSTHGYQYPQASRHHGTGFPGVGTHQIPFNQFGDPSHLFPLKPVHEDRPKVVDAISIFNQPGRASRPDRFVIILRGLSGSGKSYLAKALRDVEVASGGSAPRIHSMDDYFMTEVEKDEENDSGNVTSSLLRSKKRVTKKVMEYCYEPEMEEAYRTSMLKAFKKTLDEGIFTFIIVDDRNLRVADFAQFWAVAKRSGYEVYLLEAPYKDPAGCAARNVHGFTADKVQEMANCWESAPPLYLQLDISALFRGDDLNAQDITEVEMDTDDTEHGVEHQEGPSKAGLGKTNLPSEFPLENVSHGNRWRSDVLNAREAKDLARSKWSDDHEEDKNSAKEVGNIDSNALSGLMQAYGKGDRCVRWADQGGKNSDKGFSIGRLPQNKGSLIIGPGPGYNEASNPLPEEERSNAKRGNSSSGESKRNTKILEQLRAEQESFRAVFDRRRHRIGGMEEDDE